MVRRPWMRLPMSFVPPAVRDICSNRRGGKKWQKASMWRMGPSCRPAASLVGPRALDHRRGTQFGNFALVIAELGENGIGVLAERRRGQGALVAGAVDEHGPMNGGDLAFGRIPLPVERAQMTHLRIIEDVRDAVYWGGRHVVFFEHIDPMGPRLCCDDLGEHPG